MEISILKFENEQLWNELKHEKEFIEILNKPKESMRYYEEFMRSQRWPHDTSRLGHIEHLSSSKEGESSKSGEKRNAKLKKKPTCYHCGKLGHTTNIYRSKNGKKIPKSNFTGIFFNCKKQGHQVHECRFKARNTLVTPRFEGHCYNC